MNGGASVTQILGSGGRSGDLYGFLTDFLHGTHHLNTLSNTRNRVYLLECGDCYVYSSMMKFVMSISNNHSSNCMFAGKEVREFTDIGGWCIMHCSSTTYEFLVIKE